MEARSPDEVGTEAGQLTSRQARDDHDAVGGVFALLDRRPERVELVELGAVCVRDEEPDKLEALGEALGDLRSQLVETGARQRGDLQRLGIAVSETTPAHLVDGVDLVEDELPRKLVCSD